MRRRAAVRRLGPGLVAAAALAAGFALAGRAPAPAPEPLPPRPLSERAHARLARQLHRALAAGDLERALALRGRLAGDALARAARVVEAWMPRADPETGLFADRRNGRWLARNTGADLFPHLLAGAGELAPRHLPALLRAAAAERRICGPLPCNIVFAPARRAAMTPERRLFGAAELAADGLVPVCERWGRGPWWDRLAETVDAIVAAAAVPTRFGPVPTLDAETNGNFLQAAARLAQVEPTPSRLAAIERVVDFYLLEVAPASHGLPAHEWDPARGAGREDRFRLRDHGAEILPGLAEAYALERRLERPAADRHREPMRRLLAAALAVERAADGLWFNEVAPSNGRARDRGIVDTWGYLLAAWATVDRADGTKDFRALVEELLGAAAARAGWPWEGDHPDGAADAIESMLILLPFYPIAGGEAFVDAEAPALFRFQDASGAAGTGYLDGNVIRSALLYAEQKSAGVAARPWRADLELGAAIEPDGSLRLRLAAAAAWRGRLRFDPPRHATIWGMPFALPRRNGVPEWFTAASEGRYLVEDLDVAAARTVRGDELTRGLPVRLVKADRPLRLRVTRIE